MWEGRGGTANGPLGTDVIDLPPGPALAILESPEAPWPKPKGRNDRNVGGSAFHGYKLDAKRQPIFMYRLGNVDVEEQPLPVLKEKGTALARRFSLSAKGQPPSPAVYCLLAAGGKIDTSSSWEWRVDDKLTVLLKAPRDAKPVVREKDGTKQLLLLVKFDPQGNAAFETELSW